jgi:hypothetical protein
MEKPTAGGPSSHRKAERALRSKLNRKDKPPPPLPEKWLQEPATWPGRKSKNELEMREHLPALAAKISAVLSIKPEILITHPAELRILRGMSENELRKFAADRGWCIVRRLGGRQIEFYNDAGVRTEP